MFTEMHKIIKLACEVRADCTKFPKDWLFHYRWSGKKKTQDYNKHDVEFKTVGGRTTAYVPERQKLT
eukprot:UN16752